MEPLMNYLYENEDFFGETLRDSVFLKPVGCYSCFDLKRGFNYLEAGNETYTRLYRHLVDHAGFEPGDGTPTCCTNGSISAMWFWDGDGTLIVEHALADGTHVSAINTDCKKDHYWKWLEHDEDALEATLEAQRSAGRWTKALPVREGWYWYQGEKWSEAEPVRLLMDGLQEPLVYCPRLEVMGLTAFHEQQQGRWKGPITP